MSDLASPLNFKRGPAWKNRFALAPLTNGQSHANGVLSEAEAHWLRLRAQGGFGLTMTCATSVHVTGRAWRGQLAIETDEHAEALRGLVQDIRAAGSVSSMQLHHGGIRADQKLSGELFGPSAHAKTGARAMTAAEIEEVREAFIQGGLRAEQAGFDGVELHAAHGYLLAQFISPQFNQRNDNYGGSLENRSRLLLEIIAGIRKAARPDFQIGVRLSPERFGMQLTEVKSLCLELIAGGQIDYLDMSLWDVFKETHEVEHQQQTLLAHFAEIPRGEVRLGVAGKIMSRQAAKAVLEAGCDFAMIGKGGIVCHDFPQQALAESTFAAPALPVSAQHLEAEGVSPGFVDYLRLLGGIVAAE